MSNRGLREPFKLLQSEKNSCQSCVAAQALYMFGIGSRPDPKRIDRLVGRQPNQPASTFKMSYLWLREGYRVTTIDPWDTERFLREGIAYAKSFHRKRWNSDFDAFFTEAWVEQCRREQDDLHRKYSHLEHAQHIKRRLPTMKDIREALTQSKTLVLATFTTGRFDTHQVLIYGVDGDTFHVYSPCSHEDLLLCPISREDFEKMWWLREEGIIILKR